MYSILMPTYAGKEYCEFCMNSLLENSYYKTHQIFIHVNGIQEDTINYLEQIKTNPKYKSFDIKYVVTEEIGAPEAINMCIDQARYDTSIIINDDCYFTKNWDYYLHQWEIEMNNKFPGYIKFIGYRWCEPNFGSFPPICSAGKNIKEFNVDKLNEYVSKNSVHDIGNWYFNCTYPTDILRKCKFSPEFSPKGNEADFALKVLNYLKENNKKFLIFGTRDCYVYHFQRIASTKHRPGGDTAYPSLFKQKWNMTIQDAYNLLNNEIKRSMYTIVNSDMIKPLAVVPPKELPLPKGLRIDEQKQEIEATKRSNKITISTYISTINSLFYQSTLEQTIRQSLIYSDEIVICNSSNSTDGTQNLLDNLKSEYPNKIKIFTYNEPDIITQETLADRRTFALGKCTKNYVILMDDDEMIHERYANYIKLLPEICPDTIGFRFNVLHFYRSYDHYQPGPSWYPRKIYMVKNIQEIKHGSIGIDPDNHVVYDKNKQKYIPLDSLPSPKVINTPVTVFHYGWANRNDAVLLFKKYFQEIQWWGHQYWEKNQFPFKLDDPETLQEFTDKEGHPKFMRSIIEHENKFNSKRIKEFTK